jgi:hypothetical protein
MKAQRGRRRKSIALLSNLSARWGWSTPRLGLSKPSKPTHCARCWVGPRAGLNEGGKSLPYRDSTRTVQPVASCYSDCAIPAQFHGRKRTEFIYLGVGLSMVCTYSSDNSLYGCVWCAPTAVTTLCLLLPSTRTRFRQRRVTFSKTRILKFPLL